MTVHHSDDNNNINSSSPTCKAYFVVTICAAVWYDLCCLLIFRSKCLLGRLTFFVAKFLIGSLKFNHRTIFFPQWRKWWVHLAFPGVHIAFNVVFLNVHSPYNPVSSNMTSQIFYKKGQLGPGSSVPFDPFSPLSRVDLKQQGIQEF